MIVDGKKIAEALLKTYAQEVKELRRKPVLGILLTEENSIVRRFITAKKAYAERIGVTVHLETLSTESRLTEKALGSVLALARACDGLVVQLPLAPGIDGDLIWKLLPMPRDVDVLGITAYELYAENRLPIMPPVVAAMKEVLMAYNISLRGKRVAIVGEGRLVGKPASVWVRREGGLLDVITLETLDKTERLQEAEIIILGAGSPGLLRVEDISEEVVVLDAGTSEEGGKLLGDADPRVAEKAALFTPTPGGLGPITVAMIFKNLLQLMALEHHER